jgi:mannose-6-phosphate isomerase-like protein (cupin superfamily)
MPDQVKGDKRSEGWSKDRILGERVARFDKLVPTSKSFVDTVVDGHQRDIYMVIGNGVNEDSEHKPAIEDHRDFSVGIISAEHGNGASLHLHTAVEMFMPLEGRWAIYWLDQNTEQQEVILEKHDVISVPPGIFRGFRNESGETALLFAINGNTDPGRVEWPQELLDRAAAKGYSLDEQGNLLEGGASQ